MQESNLKDGHHHGCGGGIADPHGEEGGDTHEAQHDGGDRITRQHQGSQSQSFVQTCQMIMNHLKLIN